MFKLTAHRGAATYEQFLSGAEADKKAKYLTSQGFSVLLTRIED